WHVRQNCIFREQTSTFVSSRGTAFGSRDQPALESAGFARRCRRLREGATAAVRSEKNEYLPVRKFVCAVREFSRFLPSLKNRGFSTN
ncbi:MAG: hypothetical protein IKD53_11100, partial [Clostridia bacterium]|nr:hypothetical protein [Clostridia bacterium]